MKILQVVKLYKPWIGGVEKIAELLAEGAAENNFDSEVLCCQAKGGFSEEVLEGVKVHRAKSFGMLWGMPLSINFMFQFKKLASRFDVLDIHLPFPLADLALFLFKPKAKIVVHYHSDIVRQKLLRFLFEPFVKSTLRKAEHIVVSNPNLVNNSKVLKPYKNKCVVIPFGINLKSFTSPNLDRVKQIQNQYGRFVLCVGRLSYYKGHSYLVEAMRSVDAKLVLIGNGPLKESLLSQIKQLQLEDKIVILPTQEERELVNYLHAAYMFVLPSIYQTEAFGIVLTESLAGGAPLITTELGTGTSWVNQNGVTGVVVPPKDAKALTDSINQLLLNSELRNLYSKNALTRAKENFNLEDMLEKTFALYK